MYNAPQELNTVKELVSYILDKYPETRENDTKLYVKCCKELGAETLSDVDNIGLSIISVHKIRQIIQNKEKQFMPSEKVQRARRVKSIDMKNYMSSFKN